MLDLAQVFALVAVLILMGAAAVWRGQFDGPVLRRLNRRAAPPPSTLEPTLRLLSLALIVSTVAACLAFFELAT